MTMALQKIHQNLDSKVATMEYNRRYIKGELEKMHVSCIEPAYGVTPNTLLVILKGIDICNKTFARELSDVMNVCVGVSSACQTKHNSHVLDAMKVEDANRDKIIRISLSYKTTYGECKYLIECMKKLLAKHRKTDFDIAISSINQMP
jgi:cysteine sulfinate desulfinase/cysteine desulfurase-like protein